ncbi:proline--tRNA ligase [Candidatus Avelusimicrobium gallicola]|uniref:Proline--tRNA ligase n=1 Tax=Candidatus Avelusimicrobium gallicola TaxID=2562704 RepID=A0A1Y4DKS5_9BACT|nr:proline--tRNA ligase [Elusimicrobium sp. An273]OUO56900.1 proline--tRNA ligase [Elusimicrobium sp. An273]
MKLSNYYLPTLKEAPKDADTLSAKLMIRAGLIRKVASGLYEWLPLGLKVLKKVETIVREEMNRAGACEVWLPLVQPKELWEESGRWTYYGKELLRFADRKEAEFCFAPTAEEVMTDLVKKDTTSYKQLPFCLYQFGTKFRDEIRPRFGVMRAREFYMKDAYSFAANDADANDWYQKMYDAYQRIFKRCGFEFKAVEADTGAIGGNFSHEFMVLADTGEDAIANCPACGYAANTEKAEIQAPADLAINEADLKPMEKRDTPKAYTIEDVAAMLNVPTSQLIKLLVFTADGKPVVALVRGDHELNEFKFKALLKCNELEKASEEVYTQVTGSFVGFAGAQGLKEKNPSVMIYADNYVKNIVNGVSGGNGKDVHMINVTPRRDIKVDVYADLKMASAGDKCARCGKEFTFTRGIEAGHVFKLGTKYSASMGANFLDENQTSKPMIMGCYGIGISRVVAAAIEQSHDENGIIWPAPLAPFDVALVAIDYASNPEVKKHADAITEQLEAAGLSVLLDDRDERAGIKFKDMDLIGLPHRLVVSSRTVKDGQCEYKKRTEKESVRWNLDEAVKKLLQAAGK